MSMTLEEAIKQPDRAKLRSKTFPGIARAMAEQWGGICPPEGEEE